MIRYKYTTWSQCITYSINSVSLYRLHSEVDKLIYNSIHNCADCKGATDNEAEHETRLYFKISVLKSNILRFFLQ